KELVSEIGADHALAIQADVTNREEVEHLIKTATDHFGHIDVVINNALVGFKFDPDAQKSFKDLSWDDYQKQIDGTLRAAFDVALSVIPQFIEGNIGTIKGIGTNLYPHPVAPCHEYTPASAGFIGFTRIIAAGVGVHGINANVVSDGLLKT